MLAAPFRACLVSRAFRLPSGASGPTRCRHVSTSAPPISLHICGPERRDARQTAPCLSLVSEASRRDEAARPLAGPGDRLQERRISRASQTATCRRSAAFPIEQAVAARRARAAKEPSTEARRAARSPAVGTGDRPQHKAPAAPCGE